MMNKVRRLALLVIFSLLCSARPAMADHQPAIRFGVLSIAQPSRIFANWQAFADYVSKKLGQPVEIVVPRGFGKMKKTISEGKVEFFYVNSLVFYRLKQEDKAIAVAQMQNIAGQTTSRSEIFVRRDSGIENIADLKGKNIAYVSPMGAGGYLAPRAYLYDKGLQSGIESRESFTKNLSNSLHGVLLGDYDAGTMCGVNYELMSKKVATGDLRVIAVSEDYPENVLGARSDLPTEEIQHFRQVVLNMPNDPEGRKILQGMEKMKIRTFVEYDESAEDITRKLLEEGKL
ncbi:MAG TPA: phosphate/phosphite/phosphonate ABC transporter substrate-binding protein [Gammaproteobacteria bacterium]|nr:phosphate/phosphite/phosphonate ABC transporter substrate-binding protein [Gammaproteobacteria bacterium]